MVDNRLGIELDGIRATVVEVVGHSAVSSRTVKGGTPAEALKLAVEGVKPGKKAPKIRVSLVASNAAVRRIDVTAKALTDRTAFEEAVYSAIPNVKDSAAAAGLFFNAENLVGSNLGSGLAAVTPVEAVEDAYRALAAFPDAEVVPPAFTLMGLNGLHLAIRYSNADLTLVENGHPVMHRQFSVGGLENLAADLAPGAAGLERIEALIENRGAPDPVAQDALERYLRSVVEQVSKTRAHWLRQGESVPEELFVFGAGARIRDLAVFLEDAELKVVTSENLVRKIAYIPLGAREGATGAFLAGATAGQDLPAAAYPSPVALERALAARARSRRTRRLLIGAAALVIPVAAYFGPVAAGRAAISDAQAERDSAQARFQSLSAESQRLSDTRALESAYTQLASNDPRWNAILSQTVNTAFESGTEVNSITTEYLDGEVVVTATGTANDPGATYAPLTNWLNALRNPDGPVQASSAVTTGFSHTEETQTSVFQVRFTIPAERFSEERDLGGQ